MNLKFIINSFLIIALSVTSLSAQDKEGVVIDEIIAKVDNYIVLKSDLETAYLNYLSSGNQAMPDAKCRILGQLVSQKLMVAKAEIDSVIVSEPEVDSNLEQRMQVILSQYGGSADQLEEYYGKTLDEIKADIRDDIKQQLIVQRMQETITADIRVTPQDVRKFYSDIPQDSLPYFSKEVEVAQIVKIPSVSKSEKDELRRKLNDLRKRVIAGESFEELAKEYSQGPSAKYGGNLGFSQRGAMAPEFEAASLKLKQGEISEPFETQFGMHIVQLLERRGNEYNSRHILLQAKPTPSDVQKAKDYLDSLKVEINEGNITFSRAAKEYSEDQLTSGRGGFFSDNQGGTKVSVEDLDPVVFFTIDSMEISSISKPLEFRTERGKEAVRILYYKSNVKPHQANLDDDWQKIQGATLNQKRNRVLDKWFNKARKDVFISISDEYDFCGIMN